MLNLRIVRGPLSQAENESILEQYNRSTSAQIPLDEFIHWIQLGPAGPAWHALLETDGGEIVGHHSLIPLGVKRHESDTIPAKSEYTFLREGFRAAKIRGFENSAKPTWLILLDQHLRYCLANGWGPFLISTTPTLHRFCASIGSQRLHVPLWECLLILRPWNAARKTPNLSRWERVSLWIIGLFQSAGWSLFLLFTKHSAEIPTRIGNDVPPHANPFPAFFEEKEFLRWRYLEGQYERLVLDGQGHEYLIVKKGSADRYVRVCQWHLNAGRPIHSLIIPLARMAKEEQALGVRWAFYGNDKTAQKFVQRIRRLGILCARRVRTLLIYPKEQVSVAESWRLTDAMFSFDP